MSYLRLVAILRRFRPAALALLLATIVAAVGCTVSEDPLPTLLAPVPTLTPTFTPTLTQTPFPEPTYTVSESEPAAASSSPELGAADPEPSPTLRQTATTTPVPTGIRPGDAEYVRPPELGPEATIEWRPPPVAAPHSLNPDDHYWLARPLPSDRRNYDLEYYPYGNIPVPLSWRPYRVHHGMDFPNDKGTPIFAASSGTVVFAGPRLNPSNGVNYYGNTVIILHDWQWRGQDIYTLYAHTLELFVEVGDEVQQGQLIAGVGDSGEVSGPHLHFEVRIGSNSYDSTVNPGLWLVPFEGWGTLAGRFIDNRGLRIHGAHITLRPVNVDSDVGNVTTRHLTYSPWRINSDQGWDENFLFSDIPAGDYVIEFRTAGSVFRRDVTVKPEMTNFIVVQADILWSPTATPTPTPTPLPTATGSVTPTPSATSEP